MESQSINEQEVEAIRMQSTVPGQQQQQQQQHMVVMTGNQPTPQWMIVVPRSPTTVPNYKHRRSTVVGVVLVVVGILSIVFNVVDVAIWSSLNYHFNVSSLGVVGHGFWSGIVCIVAGGFGVMAGRSRNISCQIRAFMAMCIVAACCCLAQFVTAVVGASVVGTEYYSGNSDCCIGECGYYDYHYNNDYYYYYSYYSSTTTMRSYIRYDGSSTACVKGRTLIAMESLLAILSLFGGVAAIYGSALGCRVLNCSCDCKCCCSCCCCVDQYPQQFAIIQNNGIPMTVIPVTQLQQRGQMVPAQYPAQCLIPYPVNYAPPPYPAGGPVQPGFQFTAAPPYYPPPSTALTSAQQAQPEEHPPATAFQTAPPTEPVYKNC